MPLFVQAVAGTSATDSGLITMPMMIAVAISSAIAGQIISRLGRYRLLGIAGLSVMALGTYLFSQMDAGTSRLMVTRNMVIFGLGLGTSLPLFLLVVQNAVSFSFLGVATSSVQFFRSMGGTMGVAIMGSLVNAGLATKFMEQIPVHVRQRVPEEMLHAVNDVQVLLNYQAMEEARRAFLELRDGQQLFDQALEGLRSALAVSIADAFLLAMFVVIGALIVASSIQEIPLRRRHFDVEGSEPSRD